MRQTIVLILTATLILITSACRAPSDLDEAVTFTPTASASSSAEAAGEATAPSNTDSGNNDTITGSVETPPPSDATSVSNLPTSTPERTEPASTPGRIVEELAFAGAEGLELKTTFSVPGGAGPFPGIILLHMLGSNRGIWEQVGLIDTLVTNGYAVLAVDMRGHGETGGSDDWTLAAEDLNLLWDAFTGRSDVDETRTAVVGASIGANMALVAGVDQPAVRAVVLLSPGLDYRGVAAEDAITRYGERPILLVAAEDDPYSADSARALAEAAQGEAMAQVYPAAGHGTNMFGVEPDLTSLIITWLDEHTAADS
jgi:dienelactone hydrolase